MEEIILITSKATEMASILSTNKKRLKDTHGKCYVFVHSSVDGDCVGASCAIADALNGLGIDTKVALAEKIPEDMAFMNVEELIQYDILPNNSEDFAIAVDCASGSRMGEMGDFFEGIENKIIIDHHISVDPNLSDAWIDPKASSASEMCFRMLLALAKNMEVSSEEIISKRAANCLLTGIVTDTGRFTYTNTSPETLVASGKLMQLGGNISMSCYYLFDMKKKPDFLLSNEACNTAEFFCEDRVAMSIVTREMFEKYGADEDSVSDVAARLRDVDSVDVSFVLRETEDGKIRANIRSSSSFDCAAFASQFGGGGHKRASGFTVDNMDIEALAQEVRRLVTDEFESNM
jgi:bifunctional oligoribonuclease and PAP phosphatase NrnA